MGSTLLDRIKNTNKIRVGMTPTIENNFDMVNGNGEYFGFDVDLINRIAELLPQKIYKGEGNKKFEVEILQFDWAELLPKLKEHAIDLVISSMTKTKPREEAFGVKFSKGYLQVHQVFITKDYVYDSNLSFEDNLSKRKIGVSKDTTNQRAAKFLAGKLGFEVVDTFSQYEEVLQALNDNKVDLALVDNLLVKKAIMESNNRLNRFGPDLDKYLKDYHLQELGSESEELAIAVSGSEVQLLGYINEVLSGINSDLANYKEKWGL